MPTDRQTDGQSGRQTDNDDRWTQPVTLPLVHVHGVKTNRELDYNTIKFVPYWASIQLMFGFNTSIALIFYILYVLEHVTKDRKNIENEKRCRNGVPRSRKTRKDMSEGKCTKPHPSLHFFTIE